MNFKILFCVLLVFFGKSQGATEKQEREIPEMSLSDLVNYWGYRFEEHHVITEDGYILGIHRIPGRLDEEVIQGPSKPVVLLGHGMLSSSAQWIFGPPANSMGYVLADQGYDVWMTNSRGNTYSKNHTSLDTCSSCPEFWDYCFHEGGVLDYPAIVDFILDTTGQPDMFFAGHSMGTTQYLIMLAERPEYNAKIKAGFLMAPAVFMTHATDSSFLLSQIADEIEDILHWLGYYEFLPHPALAGILAHKYCNDQLPPIYTEICQNVGFLIFGVNLQQLNVSMIPTYMDFHPAGMSTRPIVHFAQLNDANDVFVQYNFGTQGNLEHYGRPTPPEYDLSKVTAPTAIYVGEMDDTATAEDALHLAEVLPNCIHYEIVDFPGCTHLDFAIAIDARRTIYDPIITKMNEILESKK